MNSNQSATRYVKEALKGFLEAFGLLESVKSWRWKYALRRQRQKALRLYGQFVHTGQLCIDVGANVGDVCQLFLDLGARVVAVEPQEENVRELERRFRGNPNVHILPTALGAVPGRFPLFVCTASDCTSMSQEHIRAVTASGRLPGDLYRWEETRIVDVTTLDDLIQQYGEPAFVKIDVEGFEAEVLEGLRHPSVAAISFEFTPENLTPALRSIELLRELGTVGFNYSVERNMQLELDEWISAEELVEVLTHRKFSSRLGPGGDVYARFTRMAC